MLEKVLFSTGAEGLEERDVEKVWVLNVMGSGRIEEESWQCEVVGDTKAT